MSDRTYTLNIYVNGDGGGGKHTVSPTSAGESSPENKETGFFDSAKKILKLAPVGFAINTVKQVAVAEMNRVSLRTGHQLLQEKINFKYGIATRALTIGAATVGLAASGNLPMAAFTLASGLISTAMNYAIQNDNLRIQKTVEDVGIAQANIRAGAGGGRHGKAE